MNRVLNTLLRRDTTGACPYECGRLHFNPLYVLRHRVVLAASVLCFARGHWPSAKRPSGCCGLCFNEMWPALRKGPAPL